ncbi:MAG: GIY-YIG nuclease family protein [Ignavibacteriales bacterium]|nr:GIY-YIG nuclease family protein [Ignavibacteriales bacterium]
MKKEQKQINSGIYILEVKFFRNTKIIIQKFGEQNFPKGYYYYVGSGQKNLTKRVIRHFKKKKKIHWNIDYITSNLNVKTNSVCIINDQSKDEECNLVQILEKQFKLTHKIKNFGNSDCSKCFSHLLFSKNPIDQSQLLALYQSTVLFIPSDNEIF